MLPHIGDASALADCTFDRARLFEALYYQGAVVWGAGDHKSAKRYFTAAARLRARAAHREFVLLEGRLAQLGITPKAERKVSADGPVQRLSY